MVDGDTNVAQVQSNETSGRRTTQRTFFGQPWELVHIFGVETWERFSYYGMQAILLYYMYYTATQGGLGIPQTTAVGIMGAYAGSVYLSTILAAWLSDRVLGAERTLFYSAIVVMLGHIGLAVLPGGTGLVVGLVLIALGSGGVKSNASAIVGKLYAPADTRRDAGFSLYYLGINLGGFLGPLLSGWLQSTWGFHVGFGAAAIGMAIGLIQYSFGRKSLPASARAVPNPVAMRRLALYIALVLVIAILIVWLLLTEIVPLDFLPELITLIGAAAAVALFVVILTNRTIEADERRRVVAFIPLFLVNVGFWSIYMLTFTLAAVYGSDRTDLDIFGWEMPAAWVQSINPVFILLFSGVFAALWTRLGDRQPSTLVKWVMGITLVGIGYLLFLPWTGTGSHGTPVWAIAIVIFAWTMGELLFSPTGLSLTTKLSPRAYTSQMFALYFLSLSIGGAIGGVLAQLYAENSEFPYFLMLGVGALVLALIMWVLVKPVQRLMGGVR